MRPLPRFRSPYSPYSLHKYGHQRTSTSLCSFLGSDGGILGVGAPELATIVLIGYFVLGPTELYKLTREIGKFITNFR